MALAAACPRALIADASLWTRAGIVGLSITLGFACTWALEAGRIAIDAVNFGDCLPAEALYRLGTARVYPRVAMAGKPRTERSERRRASGAE